MYCGACRESADSEDVEPICRTSACPVGYDQLPGEDLRLLEVRQLLMELGPLHLAERVCEEFGVDREDLRLLAAIERLMRKRGSNGGSKADGAGGG